MNSSESKTGIPDRVLIASIMEEYRQDAWIEIVERCQAGRRRRLGVQLFLSRTDCPNGAWARRWEKTRKSWTKFAAG